MNPLARRIQRTYVFLTFGNTLAASFIWGINTLFLLDAGLSNLEAFAANAFFTLGMVLFEVPTGVIADTWGRRASYLLGTVTLSVSTLLYYLLWQMNAPFWEWAAVSMLLGLGFTFFSGAVEAWLVDAMNFAKYKGELEPVFGKGQVAMGIAMLSGSVAGGVIAQLTNLGVPFLLRVIVLLIVFIAAYIFMKDIGFTPEKSAKPLRAMRNILTTSVDHGFRNPQVRWVMLAAPFISGVTFYAFYALQPYLLELYGNPEAYSVAGLAAAIVAGSQIGGGLLAPKIRGLFKRRTSAMMFSVGVGSALLFGFGVTGNFILALVIVSIWSLLVTAAMPIRQAYLNGIIPSKQRATVLSFDSLMGSSGGVVLQPVLGRAADVWNYSTSFAIAGVFQAVALPFLLRCRALGAKSDFVAAKQNGDKI